MMGGGVGEFVGFEPQPLQMTFYQPTMNASQGCFIAQHPTPITL